MIREYECRVRKSYAEEHSIPTIAKAHGVALSLPEAPELRLFIHRPDWDEHGKIRDWRVSEASTGTCIGWGDSIPEAIECAKHELLLHSKERRFKKIEKWIAHYGGQELNHEQANA